MDDRFNSWRLWGYSSVGWLVTACMWAYLDVFPLALWSGLVSIGCLMISMALKPTEEVMDD